MVREQSVKRVWHSKHKSQCHLIVKLACLHSHTVLEPQPWPWEVAVREQGLRSRGGCDQGGGSVILRKAIAESHQTYL